MSTSVRIFTHVTQFSAAEDIKSPLEGIMPLQNWAATSMVVGDTTQHTYRHLGGFGGGEWIFVVVAVLLRFFFFLLFFFPLFLLYLFIYFFFFFFFFFFIHVFYFIFLP